MLLMFLYYLFATTTIMIYTYISYINKQDKNKYFDV